MTLRQRLECSIKTVDSVSTVDPDDICPVTPVDKSSQFTVPFGFQEKASWKREEKTMKRMLVSDDSVRTSST